MKTVQKYTNRKLTLVCGKVCSGKDTYANTYTSTITEPVLKIDIGSLVRDLKGESRVFVKDLDKALLWNINVLIDKTLASVVIVTGIRQVSILKPLIEQHNCEVIWLEVPVKILKKRYLNRNSEKDKNIAFEEVLLKDAELGLKELEAFLKHEYTNTNIINNY